MGTMNKLIKSKPVIGKPEWSVLKYDRNVFYDNLWGTDPALLECRGHVQDSSGRTIAMPLTKVFNYLENNAGSQLKDDTIVWVERKINGSMFHVTNTQEGLLFGTTGSAVLGNVETTNDFLNRGRDLFYLTVDPALFSKQPDYITFVFEVVDNVNDPHIVDDADGLYLLAGRSVTGTLLPRSDIELFTAKNNHNRDHKLKLAETKIITFGELVKEVKTCRHEGYMVMGSYGYICKLKSPFYLNKKRVKKITSAKLFSKNWREYFDDDFYAIIEEIHSKYTKDEWEELTPYDKDVIFSAAYRYLISRVKFK